MLDGQPDLINAYFATGSLDKLKGYFKAGLVVKTNESLYDSELRNVKPRVVHAHGLETSAAGLVYAILLNIPLVVSVYDDPATRILTDPPWPDYFVPLFRQGSEFIVPSNIIRNQLISQGCPQEKISLIETGVNWAKLQLPDKKPAARTTSFLALLPLTGSTELKLVIDAFTRLVKTTSNIRLTIFSEARPAIEVLSYIKKQDYSDKISLVRITDTGKHRQYLQSSDVFIVAGAASSLNEQRITLEAMARALPVIAVNSPELAEIIQDKLTGFLVAKDGHEALLQHMKELRAAEPLAAEMGARARQFVGDCHNIKNIRQELAACYLSLIKSKRKIYNFKKEENYCQKILLIRSIPLIDFLHKLFFIKHEFPYSEIFVLTNSSTLAQCQAHPLIDGVIEFSGNRFSPFQLKAKQRRILNKRFDKVIVPFTNEQGQGFENVAAMAKLLGGRETLGLNEHNQTTRLGWFFMFRPIMNKKLFARLMKKAVILIGVSLAIVFLSVCYLLIKLVNRFKKTESGSETY